MKVRKTTTFIVSALVTAGLIGLPVNPASADVDGRQTYTGEIDGAKYRVEMPEDWNGTLLLYSHGYAPEGFGFENLPMATTNRPMPFGQPTEDYLLEQGYALAASNFKGVVGYTVKDAYTDQLRLLDWIEQNVGTPEWTIATGQSLGGVVATQLAEEHPDRFDGAATFCAGYDPLGQWNTTLDVAFAVKTLLLPGEDVKLARYASADEAKSVQDKLTKAVDAALATPEGRARLALIGSLNNITGWYSARFPEPVTDADFTAQQAEWVKGAYLFLSTAGRYELEQRAGGNVSDNTRIDYTRQLVRSAQTERVHRVYEAEGADLRADLRALAEAPRIAADPAAEQFMYRHHVSTGELRIPMLTLHSTGDGGAIVDQERWYAEQVRENGKPANLRNTWVHRGGHCTISGAEEIVAVQAIERRVKTGTWPDLSPDALNAQSAALPPTLHMVFDFSTFSDAADTPKYTSFTPPKYLRPSR